MSWVGCIGCGGFDECLKENLIDFIIHFQVFLIETTATAAVDFDCVSHFLREHHLFVEFSITLNE